MNFKAELLLPVGVIKDEFMESSDLNWVAKGKEDFDRWKWSGQWHLGRTGMIDIWAIPAIFLSDEGPLE